MDIELVEENERFSSEIEKKIHYFKNLYNPQWENLADITLRKIIKLVEEQTTEKVSKEKDQYHKNEFEYWMIERKRYMEEIEYLKQGGKYEAPKTGHNQGRYMGD
jgi:flagellar motor switch protein FliG